MPNEDFIQRFNVLHEHAKRGALAPQERAEYVEVKEKFARALCAAQKILLAPGQKARSSFRVAVVFKVEIMLAGSTQKTATMDVSEGGFSTLLVVPVTPKAELPFKMLLEGAERISGMAVVAGAERVRSSKDLYRVSFAFKRLAEADAARLEEALFDAVLPRFVHHS